MPIVLDKAMLDRDSSPQWMIAPHVHVCVMRDGCVLLDLKRDKYLGLGRTQSELLALWVREWPKPRWECDEGARCSIAERARARELCTSLTLAGLLVPMLGNESCAPRTALLDMRREWISIGDEIEVPARIRLEDVANFVAAFAWARGSLSLQPILRTVERIRSSKSGGKTAQINDVFALAARVGLFRRLRPWVFAAEGRCLLHALTLVRFLSRYGFYPEWVIGVATQPWGAHSWVQSGDFLLDSNPEKVCRYTPILVV